MPLTTSSSASASSSSPSSSVLHAFNGFSELRAKGVGLDMCLKSACWTLRLVSALSEKKRDGGGLRELGVGLLEDEERRVWANTLVSAIIDERMMFNLWKWMSTGRNALQAGAQVKKEYFPSSPPTDRTPAAVATSTAREDEGEGDMEDDVATTSAATIASLSSNRQCSDSIHSPNSPCFISPAPSMCLTVDGTATSSSTGSSSPDVSNLSPACEMTLTSIGGGGGRTTVAKNKKDAAADGCSTQPHHRYLARLDRVATLFTFLTYFLRTFEQAQGDIGFWNRFWFTNWDNKKHSRRYKFFKSLTLTASLILETLKILDFKTKLAAAEKATMSGSLNVSDGADGSGAAPAAVVCCVADDLRQKLRKSLILWLRNVGDMIIYFQWIEAYKPNKILCGLCGMYSGLIGVYLVWTDNRDAARRCAKEQRIAEANKAK